MKFSFKMLLLLLGSMLAAAAAPKREESVFLFENRKVTVAVPPGFSYAMNKDDRGIIGLQLAAPNEKVTLNVLFVPDPDGDFATSRSRKEKMVELFEEYVDNSVEKAMRFEELEPKSGAGTYCVFTDAKLVGKAALPPGEYLNFTTGLKTWPGVLAIFRLFSNDTTSPEYLAALKLLRESVQERAVPLK